MADKKKNKARVEPLMMRAQFEPTSFNEESRTVELVFATDTPVRRFDWLNDRYFDEVLSVNQTNMRTVRLDSGAPLLDNHSAWEGVRSTLGVVQSHRIEGGKAIAVVRFSNREEVNGVLQDVRDGIIRNVSVGYKVHKYEKELREGDVPIYRAVDWEPYEVSLVSIPADPKSGVRSDDGKEFQEVSLEGEVEETDPNNVRQINNGQIMKREQIIAMLTKRGIVVDENITDDALNAELERALNPEGTDPRVLKAAIEAERKRSADIMSAVRSAKLKPEFAENLISTGKTIDDARAAIIEEFAKEDPMKGRSAHIEIGEEQKDKERKAITNALVLRANPSAAKDMKPEEVSGAREFRGMNLLRLAEHSLVSAGEEVRGLSAREIAQEALGIGKRGMHSTSDFPIMLGETFNRTLRAAYDLNPRTFEPFCRRTTINDFREISRAQLSGLIGNFDVVEEGGEYKSGTMSEGKESYKLAKYGKKIAITWESIINDDLGAFNRIPMAFAAKSQQKQSDIVYGILLDNPVMGDTKTLFHAADHKNYVSSGTALSEANLDIAFQKFRVQKSIEGDFLNLSPKILVVGPKNELLAYKLTSTNFVPANQANVSSPAFTGLRVIVEPRITDYAWFLAAEPNAIDTIEYAFLDGEQELFTEQRVGFDVDGLEIKARMVFAAKAIDWRGLFKNVGAAPSA